MQGSGIRKELPRAQGTGKALGVTDTFTTLIMAVASQLLEYMYKNLGCTRQIQILVSKAMRKKTLAERHTNFLLVVTF